MQSITDPVINRLELDNKMNADAHLRPYQTYSHVCSIFIVLSWTNLISAKQWIAAQTENLTEDYNDNDAAVKLIMEK